MTVTRGQGAPEIPESCSRDLDTFRGLTDLCQPLISITAVGSGVSFSL